MSYHRGWFWLDPPGANTKASLYERLRIAAPHKLVAEVTGLKCFFCRVAAMSLDAFEQCSHAASFVSHQVVAVKMEKLRGVCLFPVDSRFYFAVWTSSDEFMKEGELLLFFFFPRELYIWEDRVQVIMKMLQHVPLHDNKCVVYVTVPKDRMLSGESDLFQLF
ncbi:unnamed protein product [Schistocephalus solidus]|uniref:Thioredoxin-like_fold domain-containing protein n=1 Tax=Schistocephalus solidus TaxID=70667 RepID=A0A183T9K5_SCHSO|nr:unnamed protein product [Schistocephalus solidus]